MSIQAWIILILATIAAIVTIHSMISAKLPTMVIFPIAIVWIISVPLTTYDTHCLTAGNCNVWSWIRTLLYSLTFISIIMSVFALSSKKPSQKEDEDT